MLMQCNVNVKFKATLHEQVRYRGTLQYLTTGVYSEARWMFSAASVCLSVCSFFRTITSERLNVGRSNLAVRYVVQTFRSSSKVEVKGQGHQRQKTKNC